MLHGLKILSQNNPEDSVLQPLITYAPLHTIWDSYSLDCAQFGTLMVILVFVSNGFPLVSTTVCIVGLLNCGTWVLLSAKTTETLLLGVLLLSVWILFAPFACWGLLVWPCGDLVLEMFLMGCWQFTEIVTVPFAESVSFEIPFWGRTCKLIEY
jgi:hypothetical protein